MHVEPRRLSGLRRPPRPAVLRPAVAGRRASPRRVVDLGCGPGNLTVTLSQRWPDAVIEAVDCSPEMVAAARERGLDAVVGGIAEWSPKPDTDVVLSNAALQWVPEHADLLVRWAGQLAPGRGSRCRCPATSTPHRMRPCARSPAVRTLRGAVAGHAVRREEML